ncbi:MAG TPA: carboxypeptidase-like regulatory domain-containing protein, partial [Acidobacteriaceae bacterium]|nr:carboxypeptidase-like regulatory domain-containing protein [Acidobacteriaceae bacterium]
MHALRRLGALASLAAFLCASNFMHAQAKGLVTGTVTDSSGAVIPGASVSLRSAAGQSRTASAGPAGGFSFGGLAYGSYTLTVKQPGFEANTQTVSVESPAAISKTVALSIAAATQTVTVAASANDVLQKSVV